MCAQSIIMWQNFTKIPGLFIYVGYDVFQLTKLVLYLNSLEEIVPNL